MKSASPRLDALRKMREEQFERSSGKRRLAATEDEANEQMDNGRNTGGKSCYQRPTPKKRKVKKSKKGKR